MRRSNFIKSLGGLVAIAVSAKELGLINTPLCEMLPFNTREGDIVMNKNGKVFVFTGSNIWPIDGGDWIMATPSHGESKYVRFQSAIGGRG